MSAFEIIKPATFIAFGILFGLIGTMVLAGDNSPRMWAARMIWSVAAIFYWEAFQ